ncbi:hypothetical protein GCM10009827_104760 [Dactylosporangium maewongense]|uniref:Uncharacterized protein n=1 Tax=Dactylosporangium maewongense TaxID=634393 RepID=A0ABN2CXB9_9ACTN
MEHCGLPAAVRCAGLYAPKGIAALYVRDGVRLEPVVCSGGQERVLRAGTRTSLAVGLGTAAGLGRSSLKPQGRWLTRSVAAKLPPRLQAMRWSVSGQVGVPGAVPLDGVAGVEQRGVGAASAD